MSAVRIETFGCRLNFAESDAMLRAAQAAGAGPLSIVNGCAVTNEALRQARQCARRLKRERPFAKVVVAGCPGQLEARSFAAMPEVDVVLGNYEKRDGALLARIASGEEGAKIIVGDLANGRGRTEASAVAEARTRAFVEIQNGCDHHCTFCVIPSARGPSRSRDPDEIVAQIRRLAETRIAEVVLTGVDITAYGDDSDGGLRLGGLIGRILAEAPELKRLRLSSIDSVEVDADLLYAIGEQERLMPHLHLSLQSGDDLILKRMKRRHARRDAIEFCQKARRLRPDMAFSADLIAGFPTETDEMFERSLLLIEECGLARAHVFPFSPRSGTPAAQMPQTPGDIARARAARLREASDRAWSGHLRAQVGARLEVLTERGGLARAQDFTPLRLEGVAPGTICKALVEASDGRELKGRAIDRALAGHPTEEIIEPLPDDALRAIIISS
jgi:threonylcarbamoyladenosine tRNA methylthiotransferase MtaB